MSPGAALLVEQVWAEMQVALEARTKAMEKTRLDQGTAQGMKAAEQTL
jgi:hypothetical protein